MKIYDFNSRNDTIIPGCDTYPGMMSENENGIKYKVPMYSNEEFYLQGNMKGQPYNDVSSPQTQQTNVGEISNPNVPIPTNTKSSGQKNNWPCSIQ